MLDQACPNREQLQAYAIGVASDETADEVAAHLDQCLQCQAAIATLDDTDDTFVALLRQPPAGEPVIEESQCAAAIARAGELASTPPDEQSRDERSTGARIGDGLGEYRLLEQIGRGGMGRVYRALQTKLDRFVALKVLPLNRVDDRRAIARFEREMKAIGRLDHPNIVRAYDAREIDGEPVLVMEYVEGRDLARVLHDLGTVKTADACELIRQAALGLQYAHENGLVHRDVKPSNLMLTPRGNVKLLDLGLARLDPLPSAGSEITGAGQPMGTADYMAPEQISDSRSADIRADIYSLGCTLFKLLTGNAPFSGPDCGGTFDKLTAHVNSPAPSMRICEPSLPDDLVGLIDRMLAKSPDQRPATPADVAAALAPHCSGSDLVGLQAMAAAVEQQHGTIKVSEFTPRPVRAALPPKEKPSPAPARLSGWMWSHIGVLLLLAAAGGFTLGVLITIEHNGKKTSIDVPDGSRVAIDQHGDVNVKLPSQPAGTAHSASTYRNPSKHAEASKREQSGPAEVPKTSSAATTDESSMPASDDFGDAQACDCVARAIVAAYDTNGDGGLSAEEWGRMGTGTDFFDPNKDGRLTYGEFVRAWEIDGHTWHSLIRYARGYINRYDTNKDGVLTKDEWTKMARDYTFADFDQDGRLTPFELVAAFRYWNGPPARISNHPQPGQAGTPKAAGKQMLIQVDALGTVTIRFGMERQQLGSSLDDVTQILRKRIAENSITLVDIQIASKAPRGIVPVLENALRNTGVEAFNVRMGEPIPQAPVRLDFRIAARRAGGDLPGLSEDEIQQLIGWKRSAGKTAAHKAGSLASKYTWVEVNEDAVDGIANNKDLIRLELDRTYVLLSAQPDDTLLATDKGERAWKVVRADAVAGPEGAPTIALELDEAGGRRLRQLTTTHLERPMAVIINDRVYMAPRIMSQITKRVQITGRFKKEKVDLLVMAFNEAAAAR